LVPPKNNEVYADKEPPVFNTAFVKPVAEQKKANSAYFNWKKATQKNFNYLIPPKWLPPKGDKDKEGYYNDARFKIPGRDIYWNS